MSQSTKKIFINLPVKDLSKSIAFFKAIGWNINPQFTDDTSACVVISEEIYAMLLTHEKFAQFSPRPLAAAATAEVLVALSVESKQEVERIASAAIEAGGKEALPPQDYGFMQQRSFLDLDDHHWEVVYMDPAHIQQ